jgi:hypothetical protein
MRAGRGYKGAAWRALLRPLARPAGTDKLRCAGPGGERNAPWSARRPDVPGFWPSMGLVGLSVTASGSSPPPRRCLLRGTTPTRSAAAVSGDTGRRAMRCQRTGARAPGAPRTATRESRGPVRVTTKLRVRGSRNRASGTRTWKPARGRCARQAGGGAGRGRASSPPRPRRTPQAPHTAGAPRGPRAACAWGRLSIKAVGCA